MNLFRTDSAGSGINNYYNYVKPALNQEQDNLRLSTGLRGLEKLNREIGTNVQDLDRETQSLRGSTTPQYYQNYGGYYPGFGP